MQRHHVHLSSDRHIALTVGRRRGKPFVLEVAAGEMAKSGFLFYLSDDRVWLANCVPAKYIGLQK